MSKDSPVYTIAKPPSLRQQFPDWLQEAITQDLTVMALVTGAEACGWSYQVLLEKLTYALLQKTRAHIEFAQGQAQQIQDLRGQIFRLEQAKVRTA